MSPTTQKTAKTIKPYTTTYKGWTLTVPTGSTVTNKTACGNDDNYRFWSDWHAIVKELTGYPRSLLAHDLTYYGLNVPPEYCEAYPQ